MSLLAALDVPAFELKVIQKWLVLPDLSTASAYRVLKSIDYTVKAK